MNVLHKAGYTLTDSMTDEQLLRYSRQIMLPTFGFEGQQMLGTSSVLIVGAGGLGCPAAMYLAAAGVGHIVLVDDDVVELSNLQRQLGHGENDIGRLKTDSLKATLEQINPGCRVESIGRRLHEDDIGEMVRTVDAVLDCTDNFQTRFMINKACVQGKKILVSGAALRFEGQLMVYSPAVENCPCYQCIYPEGGDEEQRCSETGVIAPVVGVIGSMQALEAIKLLTKTGTSLAGRLMLYDGLQLAWRELKTVVDPACPVCGN